MRTKIKMKTAIVIDDERIIANGISEFIKKNIVEINVEQTFYSSIKALEYLKYNLIDIIITDIKMPKISGIELIEAVRHTNSHAEIVIITGFGTFDYAKKAMQLGVRDILTKPINQSELKGSLYRLILKSDEKNLNCHLRIAEDVKSSLLNLKLDHHIDDKSRFTVILSKQDNQNILLHYLEKIYGPEKIVADIFQEVNYFLVFDNNVTLFREFLAMVSDNTEISTIVFQDDVHLLVAKKVIKAGVYKLNRDFYSNKPLRIDLATEKCTNKISSSRYTTFHNKLFQALENGKKRLAEDAIKEYIKLSERDMIPQKKLIVEVQSIVTELYLAYDLNTGVPITKLYSQIVNLTNSQQLSDLIVGIIDKITFSIRKDDGTVDIKQNLNEVIRRYYANPELSLIWISKHILFLNPDYMGKRYQQQSGQRFTTVLTNYRILRSQTLLKDGVSVGKVANLVGYQNNPEYFNRVFKKNVGISPLKFLARTENNN